MRLPIDENGYYHLEIDRTKTQTIFIELVVMLEMNLPWAPN